MAVMSKTTIIPVAHDYNCGWCYLGMLQIRQLQQEFDVAFDWIGYELYPEGMPWEDGLPVPEIPNRPRTPSRFQLACAAQGIQLPKIERPSKMRTFNAHQATEYVKSKLDPTPFACRLYEAYWEEGININELDPLVEIASDYVEDTDELREAITKKCFADNVIPYDKPAFASGVYNVPTFWIGGERYAEQPLMVLREALAKLVST
jgi:predicted DsbA family dithiol-disulfide isomerase